MPDDDRIVNRRMDTSSADQAEASVRNQLRQRGLVAVDYFEVTPEDTRGSASDLLTTLGTAAVDAAKTGALLCLIPVPGPDGRTGAAWVAVQRA